MEPELKREMVGWAEEIIDRAKGHRNQKSQLQNLLQITTEESERLVLKNYLDYQAARKETGQFWEPIHEKVIQRFGDIEKALVAAEANTPETRSYAFQHFCGYMIRRYVFVSESMRDKSSHGRGRGKGGRR
ncbi:hypothetical protein [Sulfidibacter corallicola]|uniref:Uncharacterized protein n=1 Tax=Sulfidibacter corallicola TaxID=2818388 RepID=A0A8A4TIL6_SULCO|nr:hypothetical protein [Sulfidibacter corallicola]QTD49766.1 hypothetical protein J3U87_29635 [Sulfidibacter corallicola]